jgi:hypothetical protein
LKDVSAGKLMLQIQVTLLGRFAVTVGGVPVADASWERRHAAAVVKVLALAPGCRLHREQVIELVWPEDTIAEAVPKLHKAAHFARRAIGVPDAVLLRGDQVILCPGGSVTVDAVRFEELARRALAAGDAAAARGALALYDGELLPGDARALFGSMVRPDGGRAAPDPGGPGHGRRHLRRLPVLGRVPVVRAYAVRRGHGAGAGPARDARNARERSFPGTSAELPRTCGRQAKGRVGSEMIPPPDRGRPIAACVGPAARGYLRNRYVTQARVNLGA